MMNFTVTILNQMKLQVDPEKFNTVLIFLMIALIAFIIRKILK